MSSTEARVYYTFHPYCGQSFKILPRSQARSGRVTLVLQSGKTLAVPQWMLQPEASLYQVNNQLATPTHVLLEIIDLLNTSCSAPYHSNNTLEQLDGAKPI